MSTVHGNIQGAYCAPLSRREASFSGVGFAPHRHDTYAIGITMAGVQSFDYRGETRNALPGNVVVLHPDELHDGRAGTDAGFRYRTLHILPAQIQTALGGRLLPFIEGGISVDRGLYNVVMPLLAELERPFEELEYQDALYELAISLEKVSGANSISKRYNYAAAEAARDYIHENIDQGVTLETLENITKSDRWELSRSFRAIFGTSPYRYLVMRRLDMACAMLATGKPIASAAFASGFSDQSHFTRQFKKTYGLTPKRWVKAFA